MIPDAGPVTGALLLGFAAKAVLRDAAHSMPEFSANDPERAYTLGLIVHGWADPGNVPVIAAEQLP